MTYWKNYPNEDTPLEADNLDDFEKRIIGLMHPINTGFIAYDDTDYSDYLGFTWEKTLIGRTPVGLDNTQTEFSFIGKQGGSKYMQQHNHSYSRPPLYASEYTAGNSFFAQISSTSGGSPIKTTGNAGTGDGGNLQPYEVVNFWQMVA